MTLKMINCDNEPSFEYSEYGGYPPPFLTYDEMPSYQELYGQNINEKPILLENSEEKLIQPVDYPENFLHQLIEESNQINDGKLINRPVNKKLLSRDLDHAVGYPNFNQFPVNRKQSVWEKMRDKFKPMTILGDLLIGNNKESFIDKKKKLSSDNWRVLLQDPPGKYILHRDVEKFNNSMPRQIDFNPEELLQQSAVQCHPVKHDGRMIPLTDRHTYPEKIIKSDNLSLHMGRMIPLTDRHAFPEQIIKSDNLLSLMGRMIPLTDRHAFPEQIIKSDNLLSHMGRMIPLTDRHAFPEQIIKCDNLLSHMTSIVPYQMPIRGDNFQNSFHQNNSRNYRIEKNPSIIQQENENEKFGIHSMPMKLIEKKTAQIKALQNLSKLKAMVHIAKEERRSVQHKREETRRQFLAQVAKELQLMSSAKLAEFQASKSFERLRNAEEALANKDRDIHTLLEKEDLLYEDLTDAEASLAKEDMNFIPNIKNDRELRKFASFLNFGF